MTLSSLTEQEKQAVSKALARFVVISGANQEAHVLQDMVNYAVPEGGEDFTPLFYDDLVTAHIDSEEGNGRGLQQALAAADLLCEVTPEGLAMEKAVARYGDIANAGINQGTDMCFFQAWRALDYQIRLTPETLARSFITAKIEAFAARKSVSHPAQVKLLSELASAALRGSEKQSDVPNQIKDNFRPDADGSSSTLTTQPAQTPS